MLILSIRQAIPQELWNQIGNLTVEWLVASDSYSQTWEKNGWLSLGWVYMSLTRQLWMKAIYHHFLPLGQSFFRLWGNLTSLHIWARICMHHDLKIGGILEVIYHQNFTSFSHKSHINIPAWCFPSILSHWSWKGQPGVGGTVIWVIIGAEMPELHKEIWELYEHSAEIPLCRQFSLH